MDRRTTVKLMTTVICLSLSIFALFTFWSSAALSLGRQVVFNDHCSVLDHIGDF